MDKLNFNLSYFTNKNNINNTTNNKISYYKKDYYNISNHKDLKINIKQNISTIEITAEPKLFKQTIIEPQNTWFKPDTPGIGSYLNYDILYSHAQKPVSNAVKGLLNPTFFYKQNVLTSDFKFDYSTNDPPKSVQLIRLETKIIRDFPDKITTLMLGDVRTNADLWGQPILYGGINYGTNFDLQPGFIYYPLPNLSGETTIPSAIDLYINDVNRQHKNISEGPFEIQDLPTINGGGEVKVIQKDLLGREKTYIVPYYLSKYALKPGVKQYSISTGFARNKFGTKSNEYKKNLITTINYKHGLTNNFTYALRAEYKKNQQAAGIRATYSSPQIGEINLVTVASYQDQIQTGLGNLSKLIYIRQYNSFNLNLSLDHITEKYIEIGQDKKIIPYRNSFQAFIGVPFKYNNSMTLNYISRINRHKKDESLISANYYHNIAKLFNLSITTQFDLKDSKRKVVFINLVKAFDNISTSLSSNIETDQKTRYIASINKGMSEYNNMGYGLRISKKENIDALGLISYNNPYNKLQAELDYINSKYNYRLSAQGGITYYDKYLYFSKPIQDSFAVIDTNNFKNIDIYHNNRLVAKTNSSGRAIIPNLNSFDNNTISIQPNDLPLSTKFEQTKLNTTPYRLTGNILKYQAFTKYSIDFNIINKNKNTGPIKTGAHITDEKNNLLTLVGYNGFVYLNTTSIDKLLNKKFIVNQPDSSCSFIIDNQIDFDENNHASLGNISCG